MKAAADAGRTAAEATAERVRLSPRPENSLPTISVVAPAYDEEAVIGEFYRRVTETLSAIGAPYEIVLVNDGSKDMTLPLMHAMRASDPRVTVVDLSRNFGKELALSAGLDHTSGDVVVVLDADLQDPPELIPELLAGWRQGYDVVYGVRSHREGESWMKKTTAQLFYRFIRRVSRVDIPQNTGDFRLMTRRVVHELSGLREQHRFMKGLFAWVGFPAKPMLYRRQPRLAGQSKWSYWHLWNLALEGITSFTIGPLKIATYLGLSVAVLSLLYAAVVIWKTLMYGDAVRGYPSLMAVVLFLGGVQLISVGVLGEYIGRIFDEVKQRPLYLVNHVLPSQLREPASDPPSDSS
ncbi:glycosyltransferase family 2 protein [Candidatus Accumulibacter sp. ACC003]|uniref:glycosyltransferase family 2 protein n=1 Tax=Candidatus Accumulibacter sp. ACC003 TaxID=2823334 RepID=UPI0025BDC7AB|nr:glycosyltransferase family 2 protein [Candidatus Accumulibacter sp. ACC003]